MSAQRSTPIGTASKRTVIAVGARTFAIFAFLLLGYSVLPISPGKSAWAMVIAALVGMTLLVAVFILALRRILGSQRPTATAIESLALVYGVFLIEFAMLYVALSAGSPEAFTEPVNKVAGIYFSLTVLTTVGFGDITAVTDMARILVSVQMLTGVLLLATAVKILAGAAKVALKERQAATSPDHPGG